ncbi:MAG TPA: SPFH domain-containing protein, partial [Bifidobacterium sp.]|nr:SPFH domain-containing protein [Bifidobacterium sp.]
AKTVVLPASTPGGYQDMYNQIVNAVTTANEAKESPDSVPTARHRQ